MGKMPIYARNGKHRIGGKILETLGKGWEHLFDRNNSDRSLIWPQGSPQFGLLQEGGGRFPGLIPLPHLPISQ